MRKTILMLLLVLMGCAEIPRDVVVILPLSGKLKGYGEDCRRGIEIAHAMAEKPLPLVFFDNKGDIEATISIMRGLPKTTLAIIGPVTSAPALAAANIAQMLEIPIFLPAATHTMVAGVPEYVFRICFSNAEQAASLAKFLHQELGKRSSALLIEAGSLYSSDLAMSFLYEFKKLGGEIVDNIHYEAGETDFREKLKRLNKDPPDVLFIPGYYKDVINIILQARKMGIKIPFAGGDGWDSDALLTIPEDLRGENYFTTHFSPQRDVQFVRRFVEKYEKRYGTLPSAFSALGFDAYNLLMAVSQDGRRGIVDGMKGLKGFMGVTGMIYEHGEAEKSPILIKFSEVGFEYRGIIN